MIDNKIYERDDAWDELFLLTCWHIQKIMHGYLHNSTKDVYNTLLAESYIIFDETFTKCQVGKDFRMYYTSYLQWKLREVCGRDKLIHKSSYDKLNKVSEASITQIDAPINGEETMTLTDVLPAQPYVDPTDEQTENQLDIAEMLLSVKDFAKWKFIVALHKKSKYQQRILRILSAKLKEKISNLGKDKYKY